jgi:hypothetical protein
MRRLRALAWRRGDYDDVVLQISHTYSVLRGDTVPEAKLGEKQVQTGVAILAPIMTWSGIHYVGTTHFNSRRVRLVGRLDETPVLRSC